MTATQWSIPRESKEWVGPIAVTVKVNGTPIAVDPSVIMFAVLPIRERPAAGDWVAPVLEPGTDDPAAIGVQADPVDAPGKYGIWATFPDSPEAPVLDPDSVGTIYRS